MEKVKQLWALAKAHKKISIAVAVVIVLIRIGAVIVGDRPAPAQSSCEKTIILWL